jgi:nucleoside-diphosphate-sugar epimerase
MQVLDVMRFRVTRGMAVRIAADAAMINIALVTALALRFLMVFAIHRHNNVLDYENLLWHFTTAYAQNAVLMTVLGVCVFACNGFYTFGRAYQGKYKALIITQAVIQAYLIFGFVTYVFWQPLGLVGIPRGAMVLAFMINLGLTLASRTWAFLWEKVVRPEREVQLRAQKQGGRNVLVIGGAGYIGSALLPKLLENGYRVRVLDLFLYGMEPIDNVAGHPNLELVKGDFRHVEKVVEVMRDMDAVIHLGAIVGDPACELDQRVTIDVNLSATQMIAQVAKASGISRFIFASTCSVYGACDELLDEKSEVRPISLYGHTKLAAERGLMSMADDHFTPTILRFATIYGLSGRTRFDLVVNLLAAKAKTEGKITINGGDQWRPFVHVDDAAAGVFKVLTADGRLVANQIFNIGSDEQNCTIKQIGDLIHEHVFTAELVCDDTATDRRNYRVSFRKIRNQLGYEPKWTLERGIAQVVEAVANGQVKDYRAAKYSNVKFLSESGAIEIIRVDDGWSRELLETGQPAPQFAS